MLLNMLNLKNVLPTCTFKHLIYIFHQVPVPSALQILDKFLAEKKMRLIDLFRNADRNQDWKLTKEELLAAVEKVCTKIHI